MTGGGLDSVSQPSGFSSSIYLALFGGGLIVFSSKITNRSDLSISCRLFGDLKKRQSVTHVQKTLLFCFLRLTLMQCMEIFSWYGIRWQTGLRKQETSVSLRGYESWPSNQRRAFPCFTGLVSESELLTEQHLLLMLYIIQEKNSTSPLLSVMNPGELCLIRRWRITLRNEADWCYDSV